MVSRFGFKAGSGHRSECINPHPKTCVQPSGVEQSGRWGVGKSLGQGGARTEGTATQSGGLPHVVEGLCAIVDDRHDVRIVVLQQNPCVKAT